MQVTATLRHLRIAPRKVRLLAGFIKGLSVEEALLRLRHLPKRASHPMEKLLKSAAANAKHNFNLSGRNLFVKEVRVDMGPVLKRSRPRAFGRAALIRKRSSHITVTLDERTPSSVQSPRPKRVKGPEVRTATLEELKDIKKEEMKKPGPVESPKKSPKTSRLGFVRRVFQRKAA